MATLVVPANAEAGILSMVTSLFANEAKPVEVLNTNSQKMPLLEAPVNLNVNAGALLAQAKIDSTTALDAQTAQASPSAAEDEMPPSDRITTYKVQSGDTVTGIAKRFGISVNTILWANDLKTTSKLTIGQKLTILPITGVEHKVVSGDNLVSIAKKYKGDLGEIASYNNLEKTDVLKIGDIVLIPDGEKTKSPVNTSTAVAKAKATTVQVASGALGVKVASASEGYFTRPIAGGKRTQGIHGHNGVDLADTCGQPVYASAGGEVTISKKNQAWNGGYGNYIVISHNNGSQTLYSHMQGVSVNEGDIVAQGQTIGSIGATGEVSGATGCHVHFEIRGGIRNPF